jgi:indolepyruvate ferredoxin oxidoreductase, beta subunit
MSANTLNIYVSGVGGFGIGAVTRILTQAATITGKEAIGSETHGLAQRGGTVVSTLRIGENIQGSPLIMKGTGDVVIALEPLEALRSMPYLRRGGTVVYNVARLQPLAVRIGVADYPSLEAIEAQLKRVTDKVIPVEAGTLAKELGLAQAVNVILLGVLTGRKALPFDMDTMRQAVTEVTPQRYQERNIQALERGAQL